MSKAQAYSPPHKWNESDPPHGQPAPIYGADFYMVIDGTVGYHSMIVVQMVRQLIPGTVEHEVSVADGGALIYIRTDGRYDLTTTQ